MSSTKKKAVRELLQTVLADEAARFDERSEFDKVIDQEAFREKFFSAESDYVLKNPDYSFRSELKYDDPVLVRIANACRTKFVATFGDDSEKEDQYSAFIMNKFNIIGEDFIVQTKGFTISNAGRYHNPSVEGMAFIYLIDVVTSRKIFIGVIHLYRKKDTNLNTYIHLIHEVYTTLLDKIPKFGDPAILFGKDFLGLRDNIIKTFGRTTIKLRSVKFEHPTGRDKMRSIIIEQIKEVSHNFIDVVRLTNVNKHMY